MEEQPMTMSEAAKIILSDNQGAMHVNELVKEIEVKGLFKFGAKNPSSVLAGTLNKQHEIFEKVSLGTYHLKN